MKYLFGIDIGGTTVKIGLISYSGTIVDKFEIKTNTENKGASILSDIRDALYSYMAENDIKKESVKGIGFGIPGPVANNFVLVCPNLGWENKFVAEEFRRLIDWDPIIRCANDANVAALGEMHACGGNYKNVSMFTLGTGVGGAVILNGKILDGVNGHSGEFGHFHADHKYNFMCNCGKEGCLETVASATGVVRLAKTFLKNEQSALSNISSLTAKDVFDAAKKGDPVALKVVDEVGDYIGKAASIVAMVADPEVFIIGGGVSKAGQFLLDAIQKGYQRYAFGATKNTKFILASLGNDGGMLGAALLTLC